MTYASRAKPAARFPAALVRSTDMVPVIVDTYPLSAYH